MTTTTSGVDELSALASLISSSVKSIIQQQPNFPSLYDTALRPPSPPTPELGAALQAARQLVAMLDPMFPLSSALQIHTPPCLRVAIEAHVVEAIRAGESAPGRGLHVDEIAKFSEVDPKKLARVLRLLSSRHLFREVARDTFANTRTTIVLDTGKNPADLKIAEDFYADSNGFAAIVAHTAEDIGKGVVYLADTLLDPKTSHSYEPNQAAFNIGMKSDLSAFAYFSQVPKLANRFASAMRAVAQFEPDHVGSIMKGFDWKSLPINSVVADVGGGVGSVSLVLAEHLPKDTKIYVQDRPEVVNGEGKAVWEKNSPGDIKSGRVTLQAHDFFTPQPVEADVYLMRTIMHDWPDKSCIEILSHLKAAAKPSSRIVIIDNVLGALYPDPSAPTTMPFPLLPVTDVPYCIDLQMLSGLNGMERSKDQFAELAKQSGWILDEVHQSQSPTGFSQVVFKMA